MKALKMVLMSSAALAADLEITSFKPLHLKLPLRQPQVKQSSTAAATKVAVDAAAA